MMPDKHPLILSTESRPSHRSEPEMATRFEEEKPVGSPRKVTASFPLTPTVNNEPLVTVMRRGSRGQQIRLGVSKDMPEWMVNRLFRDVENAQVSGRRQGDWEMVPGYQARGGHSGYAAVIYRGGAGASQDPVNSSRWVVPSSGLFTPQDSSQPQTSSFEQIGKTPNYVMNVGYGRSLPSALADTSQSVFRTGYVPTTNASFRLPLTPRFRPFGSPPVPDQNSSLPRKALTELTGVATSELGRDNDLYIPPVPPKQITFRGGVTITPPTEQQKHEAQEKMLHDYFKSEDFKLLREGRHPMQQPPQSPLWKRFFTSLGKNIVLRQQAEIEARNNPQRRRTTNGLDGGVPAFTHPGLDVLSELWDRLAMPVVRVPLNALEGGTAQKLDAYTNSNVSQYPSSDYSINVDDIFFSPTDLRKLLMGAWNAVRYDSGADEIGKRVKALDKNSPAGRAYNAILTEALNPLNLAFAPSKFRLLTPLEEARFFAGPSFVERVAGTGNMVKDAVRAKVTGQGFAATRLKNGKPEMVSSFRREQPQQFSVDPGKFVENGAAKRSVQTTGLVPKTGGTGSVVPSTAGNPGVLTAPSAKDYYILARPGGGFLYLPRERGLTTNPDAERMGVPQSGQSGGSGNNSSPSTTVVYQPNKYTLAAAEQWLTSNYVFVGHVDQSGKHVVGFGTGLNPAETAKRLDIANRLVQVIEVLKAKKMPFIGIVVLDEKYFVNKGKQLGIKDYAKETLAETDGQRMTVNPDCSFWNNPNKKTQEMFDIKFFGTNHPLHAFFHEAGHWTHAQFKPLKFGPERRGLTAAELEIAETISDRAMQSTGEFVAETFVKLVLEIPISPEARTLYIKLGGKMPPKPR